MRDPQQARRRWPVPAAVLLLALTLAACPGGGDAPADEPGTAAAGDTQVASMQQAGPQGTCAPPPSPPDSLVREGASWANLEAWLATNNVTFPDDAANVATDTVPLCKDCNPVGVKLQSSNSTYCLTSAASAERRIAGRLTLLQPYAGQPGYDTLQAGQVMYMFSRGTPAAVQHATVVYRSGTTVKLAPHNAWRFYYCPHGGGGTSPATQWRPKTTPAAQGGNVGGGGGGSYGWMSCANGCCQFYTPPPPTVELPEEANANAPDFVPPIPKWCTGQGNHP